MLLPSPIRPVSERENECTGGFPANRPPVSGFGRLVHSLGWKRPATLPATPVSTRIRRPGPNKVLELQGPEVGRLHSIFWA